MRLGDLMMLTVLTSSGLASGAAGQTPAPGAPAGYQPRLRPSLSIARAPGPIAIDGALGDAGWVGAARADHFTEIRPREGERPAVETQVLVTYDNDNLYVAFIGSDDPASVRSSLADRDAVFQDDFVGVILDTYGDASWAYELFANPRGIQGDLRMAENRGEDDRFDLIYRSTGQMTGQGFVVEMAIPFASLRFPDREVQTWRITFIRNRPRASREQLSWASISRNDPCFLCQLGTLQGIQGVRPGGALDLIPAAVATQASVLRDPEHPEAGVDHGRLDGDLSLTARYAFKTGFTAEAALNPDFSQVESDAGQIDVNTTFALSFPERRPFFQEGGDLLSTWLSAVYTRNINDPVAAVKLIQRQGRTSLAYLGALDQASPILIPMEERSITRLGGRSLSTIARVRRTFGRSAYIGGVLTDRRYDQGGSGSLAGIDALIPLGKNHQIEFQLLGSRTAEPDDATLTPGLEGITFDRGRHTARFDGESFSGYAQYTSIERHARTWNFDFDYYATSPAYRADNGFETRNDSRRAAMYQSLSFYPRTGFLQQISASLQLNRNWNFAGVEKAQSAEIGLDAQFKGQTSLSLEARTGDERFQDTEFRGMNRFAAGVSTAFNEFLSLEAGIDLGERIARNVGSPVLGSGADVELAATIRPASWISLQPSYVHSDLASHGQRIFSGYILRNRTTLQFSRELFLRLVVEYDNFARALSIEPLLTYRVNPFTLMYLGSTRGYQEFASPTGWTRTATQYFAKVQYLIRR